MQDNACHREGSNVRPQGRDPVHPKLGMESRILPLRKAVGCQVRLGQLVFDRATKKLISSKKVKHDGKNHGKSLMLYPVKFI